MSESIAKYFNEMIRTLLAVIEAKDLVLRKHSENVARRAVTLAKKINLSKKETDAIYLAGLFHDIGMLSISTEVLQKPDKLDDGEMAMVRMHPAMGEKIISNLSFLSHIKAFIHCHHEFYDGKGYPDGLKDKTIPLGARIIALADAYDSMVSHKPYREAIGFSKALDEIQQKAGTQFDPELTKHFIEMIRLESASKSSENRTTEHKQKSQVQGLVQKVIKSVKENKLDLPVLPKVVFDIQKAIKDPITTTETIAKLIERDAVISLRLINVANSAMYRGMDKIQTVRQAVPRLGMKQTQSLISAIANKNLYTAQNEIFMEMMEKLWRHSLSSAYCARNIAEKTGYADKEKLFFMGLVHDVGKVILIYSIDKLYKESDPIDMLEIKKAIKTAHSDFGALILQRWNYAEDFKRVAKMHNAEKFYEATQKEILIVNLASNISAKLGYSLEEPEDEIKLNELESVKLLKLSDEELDNISQKTSKEMADSLNSF